MFAFEGLQSRFYHLSLDNFKLSAEDLRFAAVIHAGISGRPESPQRPYCPYGEREGFSYVWYFVFTLDT